MRLFLSSYGIGNQPHKLIELLGDNKKVAVITNAGDHHGEEGVLERLDNDKAFFGEFGIKVERLDLRDYFEDNAKLEPLLRTFGLVWVRGGNTFILRRGMAQSGFDIVIKKLLAEDSIVYGGFSAGACVMSPTLKGINLCDDPGLVPTSYDSEIIWDGLNLIDFCIAPHYKSDHAESEIVDRVVEYYQHNDLPYKTLRDGEAIVIQGDKQEFLA